MPGLLYITHRQRPQWEMSTRVLLRINNLSPAKIGRDWDRRSRRFGVQSPVAEGAAAFDLGGVLR